MIIYEYEQRSTFFQTIAALETGTVYGLLFPDGEILIDVAGVGVICKTRSQTVARWIGQLVERGIPADVRADVEKRL